MEDTVHSIENETGIEAHSGGFLNGTKRFAGGVATAAAAIAVIEGSRALLNKVTGRGERLANEARERQEKRDKALAERIVTGFEASNAPIAEGLKSMASAIGSLGEKLSGSQKTTAKK